MQMSDEPEEHLNDNAERVSVISDWPTCSAFA